jgi:predicted DNA-binding protein (UPF0251 family)
MFGFYLFKYSLYSAIFLGIAVCGLLNGKTFETAFLFVAFIVLRYCFPKTFHSKSVYRCVFYSILIFAIAIPHTLPLCISLFSSVIVGFLMTYVLYLIEDYVELKTKSELTLNDIPKDKLLDIVENSTMTNEEKSAIKLHFIEHIKGKDFYNTMGYSKIQAIRIYKSAINKINKLITK